MKSLQMICRWVMLGLTFAFILPVSGAAPAIPDDRDRQVLESLLLHLLADSQFHITSGATKTPVIMLHVRTPEKTGLITPDQIRADVGDRVLPDEAGNDLRSRNTPAHSPAGTYDATVAFYTNLTFVPRIVVADLSETWNRPFSIQAFEDAYPKACGWAEAYLPGYSKDGSQAVVRAEVGPTPHGAAVTALLNRKGDKWVVKWCKISWYA